LRGATQRYSAQTKDIKSFGAEPQSLVLYNERAMQAKQRRWRPSGRPNLVSIDRERSQRKPINGQNPIENRDEHRQLNARPRSREHLRIVLTARMIVMAVVMGTARSALVGASNAAFRGCTRGVIRIVIVRALVRGLVSDRNDRPTLRMIIAAGARAEPSVEVAAAERHRNR